jgi:hypothetical protein
LSFCWVMDLLAHGVDDGSDVSRESVREASAGSQLPARHPDRMWGGPSAGGGCGLCDQPVLPGELELELEFDRNGGAAEPDQFRVHVRCFSAWAAQLPPRGAPQSPPAHSPGAASC